MKIVAIPDPPVIRDDNELFSWRFSWQAVMSHKLLHLSHNFLLQPAKKGHFCIVQPVTHAFRLKGLCHEIKNFFEGL
jgi:hypothetical protein